MLADKVMVDVLLAGVKCTGTIVAEVAHTVPVSVRLVRVHRPRTVVHGVHKLIVVHVLVAGVAQRVPVNILLILVAESNPFKGTVA